MRVRTRMKRSRDENLQLEIKLQQYKINKNPIMRKPSQGISSVQSNQSITDPKNQYGAFK